MVVGRRQLHYTGCSLRCNLMLLIKKFVVLMKSEISTLSWQRIVFWGYPKFHSSHFFIFMVRNSILIRSNKMQPYAGIYLLQNYMFRVSSHPSSGVHKTVTAASGTGHITYHGNNLPPAWPDTWHDLYQKLRLQFYVLLMMGAMTPETCNFVVNKYLLDLINICFFLFFILLYLNFLLKNVFFSFSLIRWK